NLKQIDALLDPDGDTAGDRLRHYMSPEQRSGRKPDARSDIYSLGLVFVEMLGGEVHDRPWTTDPGTTDPGVAKAAVARAGASKRGIAKVARSAKTARSGEVSIPAGLPAVWSALLAKCIAVDPVSRVENGGELLAALLAA